MIRVNGSEYETHVDYCRNNGYVNIRTVIPAKYELSVSDIEAIKEAKEVVLFSRNMQEEERIVGSYQLAYCIESEQIEQGVKFLWRMAQT